MTRIVLLHAGFTASDTLKPLATRLREALPEVEVLTPDLLGHGMEVGAARVDVASQADALLHSVGPDTIVVGTDFGAVTALACARMWPMPPRAVVTMGIGLNWLGAAHLRPGDRGGPMPSPNPTFLEAMFSSWFTTPATRNVRNMTGIASRLSQGQFDRVRAAVIAGMGQVKGGPLPCPTLCLYGLGDRTCSHSAAQGLAETLDADFEVFAEGAHGLATELTSAVAERVAGWSLRRGLLPSVPALT